MTIRFGGKSAMTLVQIALVKIVTKCGREFTRADIDRHGLGPEFDRCFRSHVIGASTFEVNAVGRDWLDTLPGKLAVKHAQEGKP